MTPSDSDMSNSDSDSIDAEDFVYKCSHHSVAADLIEFHGVKTTRIDALKKEVAEIFRANNLRQLIENSGKAALHMTDMGLFEECKALIDTVPEGDKGRYVVKFFAKEITNHFKMNIKMEMQTSGETDAGLSAKKANIFGRGETAELTFSKGLRKDGGSSFGFSASKPLLGWQRYENMNIQIHKRTDYLRWNRADVHEGAASFMFNKLFLGNAFMSSFGFNSNWRLFSPRNDTPFQIREQTGHTTKFSFEHTLMADGRDRRILPTNGSLLKLRTEYAPGVVGDSAFLKNIFDFQISVPLFGGLFCGASFRLGAVHSVANRGIHLLDRLYLGGPFDVRGYELNSLGATADNCALGGSALLSTAFHLFVPLFPKETFFAHFFVSSGALSPIRSERRLYDLWQLQRFSAGLGLAVNLINMVRLELNYIVPLRKFPGDVCSHGIQFGAGLNFM